jgi:predicted nucleotidyltransferase
LTVGTLQLRLLLEHLKGEGVEFVLVGGLAVNAWGYLRATRDVDLVPDPSAANLEKLETVLVALGGKVEVGGDLLAGTAIRTFLRTGDRTLILTELGRVDVLQGLPQVPGFSALKERAVDVDLDGLVLSVCSLEDLLAMKRTSDRPRDRDDVEALDAGRHGSAEDKPNP